MSHAAHLVVGAAALVLLALVPYLNALRVGFLFDDSPDIAQNPLVTRGVDPIGILASPMPPGVIYRPFTVFTFAINQALAPVPQAPAAVAPGAAVTFHAVNVALHVGVTLLVCALGWQLFGSARIGVIAAAVFAVHPIHTEAVTGLVGRAEVLAAFFGVLTLLSAVRVETARGGWSRTLWRALALTSFCLALLSKESALTILPLIPLYRLTVRGDAIGRGLQREFRELEWLPYALCAAVFVVLRCYVVWATPTWYRVIALNNPLAFVPWTVRLRSALAILWDYFGLLNVPFVLSADYSYNQVPIVRSWFDGRCLAGLAVVAAALALGLRHRRPAVRFAAVFPLLTMAVTANVLFPIGTIKAERLLYLPSIGWTLLLAYAVDLLWRAPRYRAVAVAAVLALVAAYGVRTWVRNGDWRDETTFYRSMVRTAPFSAKAHYNLGITFVRQHAYAPAVDQLRQVLAIYPLPGAALAIGSLFDARGQLEQASAWYLKARQMAPASVTVEARLCNALLHGRHYARAAAACRQGLRYAPADPGLLRDLGFSLIGTGRTADGATLLRHALALNPQDADLKSYLLQLAEPVRRGAQVVRR